MMTAEEIGIRAGDLWICGRDRIKWMTSLTESDRLGAGAFKLNGQLIDQDDPLPAMLTHDEHGPRAYPRADVTVIRAGRVLQDGRA